MYNFIGSADGAVPVAGLILFGNTLYGTASGGGLWGNGTVFAVSTDGANFAMLHSFQQVNHTCSGIICPIGYQCVNGQCVRTGGGIGGGCNCPSGSHCVGGYCACSGFCGGG